MATSSDKTTTGENEEPAAGTTTVDAPDADVEETNSAAPRGGYNIPPGGAQHLPEVKNKKK